MPEFDPLTYRFPWWCFIQLPELLRRERFEHDLENLGFDAAVRASSEEPTETCKVNGYYQPVLFKDESVRDIIRNMKGLWNYDINRDVPIRFNNAGYPSGRYSKHLSCNAKGTA